RDFHRRTAVHDDSQPGLFGPGRGCIVAHAELHPDDLGAGRDGLIRHAARRLGVAEDVYHIDRLGDVAERGVHALTLERRAGQIGIDRDHAIATALQEAHHAVRRPRRIGDGPDHGDYLDAAEDLFQQRVGVAPRSRHWPRYSPR